MLRSIAARYMKRSSTKAHNLFHLLPGIFLNDLAYSFDGCIISLATDILQTTYCSLPCRSVSPNFKYFRSHILRFHMCWNLKLCYIKKNNEQNNSYDKESDFSLTFLQTYTCYKYLKLCNL
jgi:hypothetical protein